MQPQTVLQPKMTPKYMNSLSTQFESERVAFGDRINHVMLFDCRTWLRFSNWHTYAKSLSAWRCCHWLEENDGGNAPLEGHTNKKWFSVLYQHRHFINLIGIYFHMAFLRLLSGSFVRPYASRYLKGTRCCQPRKLHKCLWYSRKQCCSSEQCQNT